MSSTNKTPHLQLNQWVPSDPFLMEDMNADNQIIDVAISSEPWVKLMKVTTEQTAAAVEIDLTGIDLSKYSHLEVFFSTPDPVEYRYWNLNGISDYMKYNGIYNGSWSSNATPYIYGAMLTIDLTGCYIQIETAARLFEIKDSSLNRLTLATVKFFNSSPESSPLKAGTVVKIRGRRNDY